MNQHERNDTSDSHWQHVERVRQVEAAHAGGREPASGVFRIQPQPSVIARIDALTARMRSALSLLSENRPRDGRDD